MDNNNHKKGNIFKYLAYILLAGGIFVIARVYFKPKPVDIESDKNMTMFVDKAVFDADQKLKNGNTKEDIATWITWQKESADLYKDAKSNKDSKIKEQSKVLKDHLTKVQIRDFPVLREIYASSKKEVLAKENIVITSSGKIKDTLTFTGNFFEPSKNKKEFLKGIEQIVKDLRFKTVIFKWSDKSGEFSDYKIKSLGDSEI